MSGFLALLATAILSTLTFVAYKHPKGYRKLADICNGILVLSLVSYMAWIAGYRAGYYSSSEVSSVSDGIPISEGWTITIYALLAGYLIFLKFLPHILADDKEDKPD